MQLAIAERSQVRQRLRQRLERTGGGDPSRGKRFRGYEKTHRRPAAAFGAEPPAAPAGRSVVHSASVTNSPRRSIVTLCRRAERPWTPRE